MFYYIVTSIILFLVFVIMVWIGNSYIDFFDKEQVVIITVVALAYTLESVRKLYAGYFIADKRTLMLAAHTIVGTVVMLIFNYGLVDSLGVLTPAFAMLLGFACIVTMMFYTVRRLTSYNAN